MPRVAFSLDLLRLLRREGQEPCAAACCAPVAALVGEGRVRGEAVQREEGRARSGAVIGGNVEMSDIGMNFENSQKSGAVIGGNVEMSGGKEGGEEREEEEEDWALRVAAGVVEEAVQEGWLHAGDMALVLLLAHARRGLRDEAASLLHCLSHASIPVPGGALLDVLRAAAAHGQADFFVFLLREWVAADVTVLGGPRALEEAVPWFQRCLGAHPHAPLSPALAVSWFRRCLGAHPHGTPSPAVVQVLLHSAVSWFRRCLGAYPHAPPSPAVVRALLHVLQRKSMWHEMLDVFGSLQHYPGYHDKTGSMWHEMLDVFGSLQHCPGYHDKVNGWGMLRVNYTTLIRTLRRDVNYTTLIRTLLHCRQPKLPLTLFPNMCPISSALPYASQVNYTTVIRTLLHCRQPKLALTLFRDMLTSGLLQCDTHGRVLSARDNATTHERLLQAVRHAAHLVGDREVLSMVGGGAVGARSTSRSGRFRPAPSAVKDAVRHVALLVGDREVLGMVGGGAVAARSTSRSGRFRPAPSAVLSMAVRHAALLVGGREVLGMVGGATDAGSKSRSERIRPALPGVGDEKDYSLMRSCDNQGSSFADLADSLSPFSHPPDLPRHQLWRPQLNPSNVVRQMQEAGRADAAPVVVMALMEEREVRRALAERTAWDRRTKRAVMRMAAVARVCKIRFEAIDLSDIAGETDGSKKRETNPAPSTQSPPSESPRKTSEKSPPSQALSWEAKAEAVIRFCRHINAEMLLLPSSHACKALNFSGKFASHNFTIRCARDAPCPLIKLGADLGGDRKDGRTRSCIGHRSVTVKDSQVPRSATVDDIAM
ncbi:unnamed protein product [Closterium sp. NIES-64]|nr:unnamed protein product [Closterium sp. NIES-64]